MGITDGFGGAEGSVEAQRRALLATVAQQGSQGRAALEAQEKAAQEARTAAVDAASKRVSTAGGAPMSVLKQLHESGAGVADTYAQDAQAAQGAYDREGGRIAAVNDAYMRQVGAAIPLHRQVALARAQEQETERAAALKDREAGRADETRRRQWELEDREYELEQREKEESPGLTRKPLDPRTAARRAGLKDSDVAVAVKRSDWPDLVAAWAENAASGMTREEALADFAVWEAGGGHSYPKLRSLLAEMFYGSGTALTKPATSSGPGSWGRAGASRMGIDLG